MAWGQFTMMDSDLDYTYIEASAVLGIIQKLIKAVDLGYIIRMYHLCLLEEFDACRHANDYATLLFIDLHQRPALHSFAGNRSWWLMLQGCCLLTPA